jgi:Carbohydrate-selective porin, OprB family
VEKRQEGDLLKRRWLMRIILMVLVLFCLIASSLNSIVEAAQTITPLSEISNDSNTTWTNDLLKKLAQKYQVAKETSNLAFDPNTQWSHWQLIATLDALLRKLGREMKQRSVEKIDMNDLQDLSSLQDYFKDDLYTWKMRRHAVEARLLAMSEKTEEQEHRLSLLEKTVVHGDAVLGVMADRASQGVEPGNDGIRDAITAVGRIRLTVDAPIREEREGSVLGTGTLSTRIIGAFGRYAPNRVQNGPLGAVYPFNLYSRITSDVGAFNEGLSTGGNTPYFSQGYNVRTSLYVESLFYRQHLKTGLPLLSQWLTAHRTGIDWQGSSDVYLGVVRWWDLFDISPYRGNEMTQFQNNAFINIPGIAVNVAQPMIGYQWHQGLGKNWSMDISAATGSSNVGSVMDGLQISYETRFNYNTRFFCKRFEKPGSVYVGGYNIFNAGNTDAIKEGIAGLPNRSGGSYSGFLADKVAQAVYAGWNQEWYQGIGTSVGYLANNNSGNAVAYTTLQPGPATRLAGARQGFNAVVYAPINAFTEKHRQKDAVGIGYAFVDIAKGGMQGVRYNNTPEHVVEGFYRYQISDSFSLIPSAQMIANRLGLNGNSPTIVLGLRANYTF